MGNSGQQRPFYHSKNRDSKSRSFGSVGSIPSAGRQWEKGWETAWMLDLCSLGFLVILLTFLTPRRRFWATWATNNILRFRRIQRARQPLGG